MQLKAFRIPDFHLLWSAFPEPFRYTLSLPLHEASYTASDAILQPQLCNGVSLSNRIGLGSSQFARRYYGNRYYFLFLRVLRWFSSPGIAPYTYFIQYTVTGILTSRVTPFGHPRIYRCLLLPVDFRSLPRPSSPDSSKASAVDPYSLDHIIYCPFPKSPTSLNFFGVLLRKTSTNYTHY